MSQSLTYAQHLRQLNRHEEAVEQLLAHLSSNPEDPEAFVELALNRMNIPGALELALADSRRAVGMLPSEPVVLALQSRILSLLDRQKEALEVARSAIALNAEEISGWIAKAIAEVGLVKWKDAEESCRMALSLDPDEVLASNLLAHVLRTQGRLSESEEESRRRLERDPEDAFSFANSGWAALQRGKVPEAEELFKESLRIDPGFEYAKEGLKHSFRARSGFFRLYLKWVFLMERFSSKNRILLIVGLMIGFRILRSIAATIHPLLAVMVGIAYFLLLFGSWLANAVANLIVLKDPVARMSLERGEKIEGIFVGGGFLVGVVFLILGVAIGYTPLVVVGAMLGLTAVPLSLVFTNESLLGRIVFSAAALVVLLAGALALLISLAQSEDEGLGAAWGTKLTVAILVVAVTSWLAMIPSLRKKNPEQN